METAEPTRLTKLLPPRPIEPGVYEARIIAADLAGHQWRETPRNPLGLAVKFVVESEAEDGPFHATDVVDGDHFKRLGTICRSAGVEHGDDLLKRLEEFIGKDVLVAIQNHIPRNGRHAGKGRAIVGAWIRKRD